MTPQTPANTESHLALDSVRIWKCLRRFPLSCSLTLQSGNVAQDLKDIQNERDEKARRLEWTQEVTWIHIPVNDMDLCKDVIKRVCSTEQADHLLQSEYWSDQLHEPYDSDEEDVQGEEDDTTLQPDQTTSGKHQAFGKAPGYQEEKMKGWTKELVKTPFMDAKAWSPDFRLKDGKWHQVKGKKRDKDSDADAKKNFVTNSILYMPYLHWARLHEHNRGTKERHRDWVKNCKKPKKPNVHPRRSLDEAALRHLSYNSLMERNCDQVVTRFLQGAKQGRKAQRSSNGRVSEDREKIKYMDEPTIMVVDQLWLWILDDDTIISSFPESSGGQLPSECDRPGWCKYLHLECFARGWFAGPRKEHTAWRLAFCIINRSYSIFRHHHLRNPDLRYMEIFRKAIEHERARSADLFVALQGGKSNALALRRSQINEDNEKEEEQWMRKQKSRKSSADLYNTREDIAAVIRIRDIEEELRIILHITEHQQQVLGTFVHPRSKFFERELGGVRAELDALCAQAGNIHEKLFQTLELKQTLLSVRQNQIVLVFTIITVIFLPLGFISSIFGMNAAELSDGSPVKLKRIFAYMFPISFLISLIAFGLAYIRFNLGWHQNYTGFKLPSKTWGKRGSSGKSSNYLGSRNEIDTSMSHLA